MRRFIFEANEGFLGGGWEGGACHYWFRRRGGIEPLTLSAPSDLKSEPNTSQDQAGRKGEGDIHWQMREVFLWGGGGGGARAITGFAG